MKVFFFVAWLGSLCALVGLSYICVVGVKEFTGMEEGSGTASPGLVMREYRKEVFKRKAREYIPNNVDGINVMHGDCCTELLKIPAKCVDVVVTDPPYGVDYKELTNCDSEMGLRSVNKNFDDSKDYALKIIEACCMQLHRVCKDDCHLYFFFAISNYSEVLSILEKYFEVDPVPLIWAKNNFVLGRNTLDSYMLGYESIFFCKMPKGKDRLLSGACSNVLSFPMVQGKFHPAEKPVELIKFLITQSSRENDLVLDPFVGGGSTLVAAKETGRRCYGIEIDEDNVTLCKSRLSNDSEET